jgi:Predicted membrane-associated HD superfamily hydrolase
MKCPQCSVSFTGNRPLCPLCGMPTIGTQALPARYPFIPLRVNYTRRFMQVCALVTITAALCCLIVNYELSDHFSWSLFVLLGIGSFWAGFYAFLRGKRQIIKSMMWQMLAIFILAIIWDVFTGFRHWSLDYVLPILSACVLVALAVYGRIANLSASDYLVYALSCAAIGLGSMILLFSSSSFIQVKLPAMISGGLSIFFLLSLLLFEGHIVQAELRRRLHF